VGALAAYQYYENGYVEMKAALIMAVFFFVGGYFGARFATHIPQELLKKLFAVMLIILAAKMLFLDKH
ncbi:MAG TPA: sulfite exporter TauE/SafE family protein, partial [Hanamia sp.]